VAGAEVKEETVYMIRREVFIRFCASSSLQKLKLFFFSILEAKDEDFSENVRRRG
jgi:hypothetical protein